MVTRLSILPCASRATPALAVLLFLAVTVFVFMLSPGIQEFRRRSLQSYPPSGYCLSQRTEATCNVYTGCEWFTDRCLLKVTPSPTLPTSSPSSSPSLAPSRSTRSPTLEPTLPTRSPTPPPTEPTSSPVIPTCVYPSNRCESLKNRPSCIGFNGCSWSKRRCSRRSLCPPYPGDGPLPSSAPTTQRLGSCLLPTAGCQAVKMQKNCAGFSGCTWRTKRCLPTGCVPVPPSSSPTTALPSVSPTLSPLRPTRSPAWTDSPTSLPTRSPTESPTRPRPTVSPTFEPTMDRTPNPTPQRTPPTPFPTISSFTRFCDVPVLGCSAAVGINACSQFPGCEFINGLCAPRAICVNKQRICGTRGLAYFLSAAMLPGCVRADAAACDRQRMDVYKNLALQTDCGDSGMIPSAQGGATLRRDLREQETFEELSTFYRYELYVHPTLGVDAERHRGERNVPLRTIEFAIQRLRAFTNVRRRIVLMGPAIHRLNATIVLTTQDSFLTIYGEPGAVVSGAVQANLNWQRQAPGSNVFVANLPASIASRLEKLSPMFVNGAPAIRARYPNIGQYHEEQYMPGNRLNTWRRRVRPAVTGRMNVRLTPGLFGRYSQAQGGGCEGVFNPPVGYFCEPDHDANGGCPYQIPTGVEMDGRLATQLNFNQWQHENVQLHVFHPLRWGLWTFELAALPTPRPTSQRPTLSPTRMPSKTPTTTRPSWAPSSTAPSQAPLFPTKRPSQSPSVRTASPSNNPLTSRTASPTQPTTRAPSFPTQRPTTGIPSRAPSGSPTKSPSTSVPSSAPSTSSPSSGPSSSPVTPQPSAEPSARPSSVPTQMPTDIPTSENQTELPTEAPTTLRPTRSPTNFPVATDAPAEQRRLQDVSNVGDALLMFGKGGWQEARGDCGQGGGDWFIENTLAFLDSVNEYYIDLLDPSGPKVYYWPNQTDITLPDTIVEFGVLRDLVRTTGTTQDPVSEIHLRHIIFEKTYPTHMDDHEMPSGGDWTVHRGGAVVFEGAKDSSIYDCKFTNLGGNGVFLSRFGRDIAVLRNEFRTLGSSAILIVGDPMFHVAEPWNRQTDQNHIERVLVEENVASELGIVVKQSSGVMIAIARSVMIRRNVFFEIARAGIVFNDGFGGNNTVEKNVVFNTVLETWDHGPFNVWDRQIWIQDPIVNPIRYPFVVRNNLMFGNSNGAKGIDLDDGARNYDVDNNIVIGGLQKFKGNNITVNGNLLFPIEYACVWMTPMNLDPGNMLYEGNTCVTPNDAPYHFNMPVAVASALCRPRNFIARNNRFIGTAIRRDWTGCGGTMSWQRWQNTLGQDRGTVIQTTMPTQGEQVNLVLDKLREIFPALVPFWLPSTVRFGGLTAAG